MINNKITCCCGATLNGQVFRINPGRDNEKALVYVNRCGYCEAKLAEIRKINKSGQEVNETKLRTGNAAERLYEKYATKPVKQDYVVRTGSKVNEYTLCNYFGNILNLNGRYVCSHSDFLAKVG